MRVLMRPKFKEIKEMGYYINTINGKQAPAKGKAAFILNNVPGSYSCSPTEARTLCEKNPFPDDVVVVVDNGFFEAAGYAYCREELVYFLDPNDSRRKVVLHVPGADLLSGYKK